MNRSMLHISCAAVALLSFTTAAMPGATEGHISGLTAKITMADGTNRTARFEGVGCSASICSRTVIKAEGEDKSPVSTWLDSLSAITDTTANDALFISKDGTRRRLTLLKDFRVIYIVNRTAGTDKVDLAKVKSIEFLPPVR